MQPPQQAPESSATLQLLLRKGIISQAEYDAALRGEVLPPPPPVPSTPPVPPPGERPVTTKWQATLYGFAELDSIYDSTESFTELPGNGAIVRPGTYAADNGRMIFSIRNSRFGFSLKAPDFHGMRASALAEMDFLGNQPAATAGQPDPNGNALGQNVSEATYFGNPTLRMRHYYLKLETPFVDLLAGQYWALFGWQSLHEPATILIRGVPGEVYFRVAQLRLSHVFGKDAPVSLEVAAAAMRPAQGDSYTPDGEFGVQLFSKRWQGLHSIGSVGTSVQPLSIGFSSIVRRFQLPDPNAAANTVPKGLTATGWGVSVDALIPILPGRLDRSRVGWTVQGSYVYGYGIADQYTGLNGGIAPQTTFDGKAYNPMVDAGLVQVTPAGNLETVHWQSFLIGTEVYFPHCRAGDFHVSANYSQMDSNNIADFGAAKSVFNHSQWADGNVFYDLTPAVRFGTEFAWFHQLYQDGTPATNYRVQLSTYYIF